MNVLRVDSSVEARYFVASIRYVDTVVLEKSALTSNVLPLLATTADQTPNAQTANAPAKLDLSFKMASVPLLARGAAITTICSFS